MKKLWTLFTTAFIMLMLTFSASAATIENNGYRNIYIDINSGQYSAMASVPTWGQYAYTPYGCAWFATARTREITGKNIPTIYSGYKWYWEVYDDFGFARGSTPAAKALACYENHVSVVEIVDGDTITISTGGETGGNSSTGYTKIKDISRSELERGNATTGTFYGYVYLGISHADYEVVPIGVVDECKGGAGNVFLRGWSFDRTDLSKPTNIHVYIGEERHEYIYADKERADVNNAYGCGNYHGFNATLNTALSGEQTVRVYAINNGGKINPLLYTGKVNIASVEKYVFDINMIIDGKEYGMGEKGFTFDLWLNGTKVKNDVSDYAYGAVSKGTKFEIKDIKCPEGYEVKGGTTTGTVTEEQNIKLMFEKISAHKHSYISKITKSATCGSKGTKTFTCSCGDTYTEEIKATGAHKYSNNCDTICNVCSAKRTIKHTYSNNCDTTCNVCKAKRSVSHAYKTVVTTKATLSKNGKTVSKCSVCGAVKSGSTKTVYYPKTIKLSATSYVYNGKTKTPSVTVKDYKGNTLKKDTDYTVKYSSGRKSTGKYTVTVTFKGKYSGTKTLTFTIVPKAVTLSKVTAGSKQATATWKTVTGASGYQVQYSTSSKFKSAKTATVSGSSSKKTTIKKLTKGKKYYFKVRAYKTVGSTKVYGAWSSVKNVKVK